MSTFQVDSEAVLAHAAAARQTVGRIQNEVASLHAQLEQLQASWTGGAAAAFHGVVSEWRVNQERVEDNLTTISSALTPAGQQYAEIDQSNKRVILQRRHPPKRRRGGSVRSRPFVCWTIRSPCHRPCHRQREPGSSRACRPRRPPW